MKIPKRINVKTALIFVAIGILITSGLFYVFAATPSNPVYIGSGIYPSACSFTVWKEGSNYFAKDGYGQLSSYSGTNATHLVQNLIDNLPNDMGSIMFKTTASMYDPYVLANITINAKDRVTIKGESFKGVYIEADTGASYIFNVTGDVDFFSFENLDLNGKSIATNLIALDDCDRGSLQNILCYGATAANIDIGSPTSVIYLHHVYSHSPCESALSLHSGAAHIWISDCEFGNGTYASIVGTGANEVFISNTKATQRIIFEYNDKFIMLSNVKVAASSFDGIKIYRCTHVSLSNIQVCNVGTAAGDYDGITISSHADNHDIQLSNVDIFYDGYGTMRYGLNIAANNVSGSNIRVTGASTSGVYVTGSDINLENVFVDGTRFIFDSGTSFPTNPIIGQQFYRTDLYGLYIWNNTDWAAIGQGPQGPAGPAGTLEGQQPYDYLVFINATSTYMINGTTGDIDFSGSPTATINNALGNATGTVLLCSGIYTLTGDTGLTMDTNDITLRGMGDGTSLECEAGFDDHIIHVTADYVTICDLRIDGTNQAASYHGILEDGNGNGGLFVHHVRIRDCGGDGIRLGDTDASWEGNWAKIHHVVIQDNGVYGIHFTYDATDSELMDFLISGHDGVGDAGINVGCDNIRINTGHLWGNEYEMKIAEDDYSGKGSVNGLIVSNVGFMDGGEQGEHRIYHAGSKNFINSVFSGCEVWVAKLAGVDTYDGFYLAGDTWCVSITGCVFRGDNEADTKQGRYGIFMDASVHNCTIVSNTFEGFCQADPIQTTGALNLQEGYNVVFNCG